MIEVQNLEKRYGDLVAVSHVSFVAPSGGIYGLLGPNGAGKSTTIGCISGLLTPNAGSVRVNGKDVTSNGLEAKRGLGVVPQEIALYAEVSATENLRYWGGTHGLRGEELRKRVSEALALTELADRAKEPVKRFSGGMMRRLNFACGIVHRPKVLLLDEPTVGVDPQSRVKLLDLVRREAQEGTCVLYTTHYMEEAQSLCDNLGIIDRGRLIAQGTLQELRNMTGEKDVLRLAGRFPKETTAETIARMADMDVVHLEEDSLRLTLKDASKRLPELFNALTAAGAEVRETTLTQPSLESLFIKLTGKELRDA